MFSSHRKKALAAGLLLAAAGAQDVLSQDAAPGLAPPPRVSPHQGLPDGRRVVPPGTGVDEMLPPPARVPAAEQAPAEPVPGAGHAPPAEDGAEGAGHPCPAPAGPPPRNAWSWRHLLGEPADFGALPLGAAMGRHFQTQVDNGVAARMTLYDYDFACGTEQLNLRGKDRLVQIVTLLLHNHYPLVIERTPCAPGLAEARRLAVLQELGRGPVPVPPERVVIGPPLAVPLQGWEAVLIYENLLRSTVANGQPAAAGAGGFVTQPGPGVGQGGFTGAGRQ